MSELLETQSNRYDELIIKHEPQKTVVVTFAVGAVTLARGSVVGMITASEQYALCNKAAEDGSQVARAILMERVVLNAQATRPGLVLTEGVINENLLAFAAGTVVDDVREDLRTVRIILKSGFNVNAQP